jgi:hypothetical protein
LIANQLAVDWKKINDEIKGYVRRALEYFIAKPEHFMGEPTVILRRDSKGHFG